MLHNVKSFLTYKYVIKKVHVLMTATQFVAGNLANS